jgi:hypothetical protein
MDTADRIWAAIGSIATAFDGQFQVEDNDCDCGGWGQFLDGPRPHRQIGLYGTSAGLLCLGLAGRGTTPNCKKAQQLFLKWWNERAIGYAQPRFCQNARLAFSAMCMTNSGSEQLMPVARSIQQALLDRLAFNQGWWGDYYVSERVYDSTPRYLTTALAVLSLSILEPANGAYRQNLVKPCENLELVLRTNTDLTTTERALLAAAIISGREEVKNRDVLFEISKLALEQQTPLSDHYSYFFEFQYAETPEHTILWDRDSVYLFSQIFIGIAGFLTGAPPILRLKAEAILENVLANIENEGGRFCPVSLGRVSTVEQAWCCLFLAVARRTLCQRKKLRWYEGWLRYRLFRKWKPNKFTEIWFPIGAMAAVTIVGVVPLEGFLWNASRALAMLAVCGLYGQKVVARLFPWRSE